MDPFKEFVAAPSVASLQQLKKDDLRRVIEYYKLTDVVHGRTKKSDLIDAVQKGLMATDVLKEGDDIPPLPLTSPVKGAGGVTVGPGLSFAEQKELLAMQLEFDVRERQRDREVSVELEKMRQAKARNEGGSDGKRPDNLGDMVRLLPKFNEKDPDVFFSLLESLAEERGWGDSDRTSLIQSVLPPKAQEAYLALEPADRKVYVTVKAAILLSIELCAEAYRSRFRTWRKSDKQTHVEVARELMSQFKRWRDAAEVTTLDDLCEVMLLEQFKNITQERIVDRLNERKPKTLLEAARWADEFVLRNKGQATESCGRNGGGYRYRHDQNGGNQTSFNRAKFPSGSSRFSTQSPKPDQVSPGKVDANSTCHYCLAKGHWKGECPILKGKRYGGKGVSGGAVKPQALTVQISVEGTHKSCEYQTSQYITEC